MEFFNMLVGSKAASKMKFSKFLKIEFPLPTSTLKKKVDNLKMYHITYLLFSNDYYILVKFVTKFFSNFLQWFQNFFQISNVMTLHFSLMVFLVEPKTSFCNSDWILMV